jgi:hypothetical protein
MAKKKTKKVTEEIVTAVEETVVETPVVVEEKPLTPEEVKSLEETARAAFKALFSKK